MVKVLKVVVRMRAGGGCGRALACTKEQMGFKLRLSGVKMVWAMSALKSWAL